MTEEALKAFIQLAIPTDRPNAEVLANSALSFAILKLGRMPDVDWNREVLTFNLTSGKKTYILGQEIITRYPNIWNMQELWRTDTTGWEIPVLSVSDFSPYARGSTTSGAPEKATLYSNPPTLEIYPSPDSNYTISGYVRKEITALKDIPEIYYDVLKDLAILCIQATTDPNITITMLKEGLNNILGDSLTVWTGNTVGIARHLGDDTSGKTFDSRNLRGS